LDSNAEDTKVNLILACAKYCEAMQLLMLHRILTDDEQEQFQDLIDVFFQIWVDLFSMEAWFRPYIVFPTIIQVLVHLLSVRMGAYEQYMHRLHSP
jgi:hypothetical protein